MAGRTSAWHLRERIQRAAPFRRREQVRREGPAWAEDDEVDWLIGLRNVFRIAARIALESGLYEESLHEVMQLGVIDRTPRAPSRQ